MPTGFGTGQVDLRTVSTAKLTDLQLRAAAGDHTALLQLIERHLSRIDDKYCEPAVLSPQQITIKASSTAFVTRLDLSTQPHNAIACNVVTGTLNLFLGDYSGISQGSQPHFQFVAGSTVQLFFPYSSRVYTVINPSSTQDLVACITPMSI